MVTAWHVWWRCRRRSYSRSRSRSCPGPTLTSPAGVSTRTCAEAGETTGVAIAIAATANKPSKMVRMSNLSRVVIPLVPTISFRLLYGLLIVQHGRREILWLGATTHPSAEWISRQLTEAYGWGRGPRYLIRDRDSVYGLSWPRFLWTRYCPMKPRRNEAHERYYS